MRIVLLGLALAAALACNTTKSSSGPADKPLVPEMSETPPAPKPDNFMPDVKSAVAAQLECPEDQVNLTCIRRDSQQECVAVRGDGCDKTVEYQFGDV